MKSCRVTLFCALYVMVCLSSSVQAQIRVNVPFNFIAAGKSLPAGTTALNLCLIQTVASGALPTAALG